MSRIEAEKFYHYSKEIEKQLAAPEETFDWEEHFLKLLSLAVRLNHRRLADGVMELTEKCYCVLNEVDEAALFAVRQRYSEIRQRAGLGELTQGWDYLGGLYRRKAPGQKEGLKILHKVWNSVRLVHLKLIDEAAAVCRICSVWEEFLEAVPFCLWTEEYFSESAELLLQEGKQKEYGMYVQFLLDHIQRVPAELLEKVNENVKMFGL